MSEIRIKTLIFQLVLYKYCRLHTVTEFPSNVKYGTLTFEAIFQTTERVQGGMALLIC